MTKAEIIAEIRKAANEEGIDPELFQAICQKESSLDPWAIRFEPQYRWLENPKRWAQMNYISEDTEAALQRFSYGLAQIMGGVLRQYGYAGRLQVVMSNPAISLAYAAKHLKRFLVKYPKQMDLAIASYNAGSPVFVGDKLKNQNYVDGVLENLQKLRSLA